MKSLYVVSWVSDSANGNASVPLLAFLGAGNECEASADETNRQRLRLLARALDAGHDCEANGGDLVVRCIPGLRSIPIGFTPTL